MWYSFVGTIRISRIKHCLKGLNIYVELYCTLFHKDVDVNWSNVRQSQYSSHFNADRHQKSVFLSSKTFYLCCIYPHWWFWPWNFTWYAANFELEAFNSSESSNRWSARVSTLNQYLLKSCKIRSTVHLLSVTHWAQLALNSYKQINHICRLSICFNTLSASLSTSWPQDGVKTKCLDLQQANVFLFFFLFQFRDTFLCFYTDNMIYVERKRHSIFSHLVKLILKFNFK